MPITKLPPPSIRALGSGQSLTQPSSLVKELIDNGLDAGASSVSVDISLNTVDIVQVRDNGHGIPVEDRAFLGKRYYTSKITGLEDLRLLGGRSLGFRGEALASACEMSGKFEIATRGEHEAVGERVRLGRMTEVVSQEKLSHAVGTTVRVEGFLKYLPVRWENAVKMASKSLMTIKEMMQAYAFARPAVRFSLRALNAKGNKYDWMYAPGNEGNIMDTALQVVGREAAGECTFHTHVWHDDGLDMIESHGVQASPSPRDMTPCQYRIKALLLKFNANTTSVSSGGSFFSIDSRPVSSSRGTLRQIMKLYKSHLRSVSPATTISKLKTPFIYMAISCPPGSYDANSEPAKDDIIFERPDQVLAAVETLFMKVYGQLETEDTTVLVAETASKPAISGFELLMATRRRTEPASTGSELHPFNDANSAGQNRGAATFIPIHLGDDRPGNYQSQSTEAIDDNVTRDSISVPREMRGALPILRRTNPVANVNYPWTRSKLNLTCQASLIASTHGAATVHEPAPRARGSIDCSFERGEVGSEGTLCEDDLQDMIPALHKTQQSSSLARDEDSLTRHQHRGRGRASGEAETTGSITDWIRTVESNPTNSIALSGIRGGERQAADLRRGIEMQKTTRRMPSKNYFITARELAQSNYSGGRQSQGERERAPETHRTSGDSLTTPSTPFDLLQRCRPLDRTTRRAVENASSRNRSIEEILAANDSADVSRQAIATCLQEGLVTSTLPVNVLMNEQPKRIAGRYRLQLEKEAEEVHKTIEAAKAFQTPPNSSFSPQSNRYIAALQCSQNDQSEAHQHLAKVDSRNLRTQLKGQGRTPMDSSEEDECFPRSVKRSKLPLESVDPDAQVHNLVLNNPVDMSVVKNGFELIKITDRYILNGDTRYGPFDEGPLAASLTESIAHLIRMNYYGEGGVVAVPNLKFDRRPFE